MLTFSPEIPISSLTIAYNPLNTSSLSLQKNDIKINYLINYYYSKVFSMLATTLIIGSRCYSIVLGVSALIIMLKIIRSLVKLFGAVLFSSSLMRLNTSGTYTSEGI